MRLINQNSGIATFVRCERFALPRADVIIWTGPQKCASWSGKPISARNRVIAVDNMKKKTKKRDATVSDMPA